MAYGKLFSETMRITTPPTTTPSEPSAAAFPQGQAAFPKASTPKSRPRLAALDRAKARVIGELGKCQ
jgi:hypothetical protein